MGFNGPCLFLLCLSVPDVMPINIIIKGRVFCPKAPTCILAEGPCVYFGRRPLCVFWPKDPTYILAEGPWLYTSPTWAPHALGVQGPKAPHMPCMIKWEDRCKFNICDLKIRYSFIRKCNVEIRAPWCRLKPSVVPTLMGVRLLPGVCTTRKL